ncbi:MAG: hypothetical protein ACMXYM_01735 [Candidatus Woesearchaeota archaeon]
MAKPENVKLKLEEFRLTYKDLFVFKPLYRVLHKWYCENNWQDQYGKSGTGPTGAQFFEIYYIHRETGGGFYDITILWEWYKPYWNTNFRMKMQVEFVLLGGKIEERRIGDRKVKGESGEFNMFIRPSVELLKSKAFDESPFLRRIKRPFFGRYTSEVNEQISAYCYSKAKEVHDLAKSYLDSHGSVFGQDQLIHRKWEGV